MSRTGVGVRLVVDGIQVDDGCLAGSTPGLFAEDALSITWGRDTSIDQPEASACTFAVVDEPGGLKYTSLLRVGSAVQVYADAEVSGTASLPAFSDPGFATELRVIPANAVATRRSGAPLIPAGQGFAASLQPVVTPGSWSGIFPPDDLEEPGQNPNAWDDIPQTAGGETWSITVQAYRSAGVTVRLYPVLFSGPYAGAATVDRTTGVEVPPGAAGWVTLTLAYTPETSARWVGFQVEAYGGQTWDAVPPALTWDGLASGLTWDDLRTLLVDDVAILAPTSSPTTRLVFQGRITDMTSSWAAEWDSARVEVTASDYWADLGNRYVGSEPWPRESVTARLGRILTAAAIPGERAVVADIAPTLGPVLMAWDDVDNQPAADLLHEVAESVDGVMWSAVHMVSGPYLKLEDPTQRLSMYELKMGTDGIITVVPRDFTGVVPAPLDLSACDVLRDPVQAVVDVSDLVTRAVVEWQEETVTPLLGYTPQGPQPTPLPGDPPRPTPLPGVPRVEVRSTTATESRTVTVIDAPRESTAGTRAISVATLLTTAVAATTVADRLLSRQDGAWRVTGLVVADEDFTTPDRKAALTLLALLDGVTRGGLPIRVTDLPEWSPVGTSTGAYVEGGEYSFTGGGWSLALHVSRTSGLGQSAQWNQLPPDWQWQDWHPALTWNDLRGVAGPPAAAAKPTPE